VKSLDASVIVAAILALLGIMNANACTDFRVTAKDGTVLIGRSLEFSADLKSNIRTSQRGRVMTTTAPDGTPGITWKAKYGYLFLDGMDVDATVDGINEAGLSFGALYLPGFAEYQTVPTGQNKQALPYLLIGDWILANFKTVEEVRQALPTVFVFTTKIPGHGDMVFPLHFSVYDSTGKGIVAEYIGGKLEIHDNQVGVLTNSPNYDWHIKNLQNYAHLAPVNPKPVVANGLTFAVNGQGFGMIGLPGDVSPPSRFVKIATLGTVAIQTDDAAGVLNLAEHMLNNVDVLRGEAREPTSGNYSNETTQWVVFKDLTHKIMYYRTYENMTLRGISLAKLDFSENAPRLKMPIVTGPYVLDLTNQFAAQKGS